VYVRVFVRVYEDLCEGGVCGYMRVCVCLRVRVCVCVWKVRQRSLGTALTARIRCVCGVYVCVFVRVYEHLCVWGGYVDIRVCFSVCVFKGT